jgi:hypothetical protein
LHHLRENPPNDDVVFGHGEAAKKVDDEPRKEKKMFELEFDYVIKSF